MATTESKVQGLLDNNRKFAETWETPPTMVQMRAASAKIGGALIVVTCLDPRVVPERFFGPDFANAVVRNAGGRVNEDVINSITVLRSLADASAVLVIHHTDCGVTYLTEDGIRQDVKTRTPDAVGEIPDKPYGCLAAEDFEKAIRDDVDALRKSKVLAGVEIRGMALDTVTGLVRELEI